MQVVFYTVTVIVNAGGSRRLHLQDALSVVLPAVSVAANKFAA